MLKKNGSIEQQSDKVSPILINPQGKRFEVSFLAAYIWDHLDGRSPLQEVVNKVREIADTDKPELYKVAQDIVGELKKVNLITEATNQASKR